MRNKISISSIQINVILKEFIKRAKIKQKSLSLYDINKFKNDIIRKTKNIFLLFPAHKMESKKSIDIAKHNDNIDLLKYDVKSFNQTIDIVYNKIKNIDILYNTISNYYNNRIQFINNKIKNIKNDILNNNKTFIDTFSNKNNIDLNKSNVSINTEQQTISINEQINTNSINLDELDDDDIRIEGSSDSFNNIHWQGNKKNIFDYSTNDGLFLIGTSNEKENVTTSIIFPLTKDLQERTINKIKIITQTSLGIVANVYSSNDTATYEKLNDLYILPKNNNFEIPLDSVKTKYIKIDLIKSNEDNFISNLFQYYFHIIRVEIDNVQYSIDSYLYSNKIQKKVDNEYIKLNSLYLETDQVTPSDTSIKYEVSTDGNVWNEIIPSYDNNKHELFFNSLTGISINDIRPFENQMWSEIQDIEQSGLNKLYNLLYFGSNENNYEFCKLITNSINNRQTNKISIDNNKINTKTFRLRRGKNDYAVIENLNKIPSSIDDIIFKFTKQNNYLMPLHFKITEEANITNNASEIITRFPIVQHMPVIVEVENEIIRPDGILNKNQIVLSDKPNIVTKTTYYTTIQEYEKINQVNIIIKPETLIVKDIVTKNVINSNNFIVDIKNKQIEIIAGSSLTIDSLDSDVVSVFLNYKYDIVNNNKTKTFRTFVEINDTTSIKINPFTEDEITAGNFHIIDGNVVSLNKEYTLTTGKHEIYSTNPHALDPENPNDVNILTKQTCSAGIIINSSIIINQYAFDLPQRQVSKFNLFNSIKSTDSRSYAIDVDLDGNISVLLNYIPDQLPRNIIETKGNKNNNIIGNNVYAKKTKYTPNGLFDGYESIPETFTIEFDTTKNSNLDGFYYRAKLERKNNSQSKSPILNRLKFTYVGE